MAKYLITLFSIIFLLVSCAPAAPESGEDNIIPGKSIGTQKETIEQTVENQVLSSDFSIDEAVKSGYDVISCVESGAAESLTEYAAKNKFWADVTDRKPASYKDLYYLDNKLLYYTEYIFDGSIFTKTVYVMPEEGLYLDGEMITDKKTLTFDRVVWTKCFEEKEDYTKKTADGKAKEYKLEAYLVNGDLGYRDIHQTFMSMIYLSTYKPEHIEKMNKYDLIQLRAMKEITEEDIKLINGDKEERSKYTEVYNYNGYLCAETVFIPGNNE